MHFLSRTDRAAIWEVRSMPARTARGDHYMKAVLTPLLTPLTKSA